MEYYIFDFDGVIGNSRDLTFDIHNSIASKYGLDKVHSQDDYLNIVDNFNWKKIMKDEDIVKYYSECNKYYEKNLSKVKLYPYIKKLLQNSSKEIVIITSTFEKFVYDILKYNGIDKKINVIGKKTKPSKIERFELFLDNNKIKRENIIYIGDTMYDYIFCKKSGIRMIGSNYGYSNLKKIENELVMLFETDKDLYDYLCKKEFL